MIYQNSQTILDVQNLHASTQDTEILKGINLTVNSGEIHAIMGLNGSGKSTFAKVLAGHPDYEVTQGNIQFEQQDLLTLNAEERAQEFSGKVRARLKNPDRFYPKMWKKAEDRV